MVGVADQASPSTTCFFKIVLSSTITFGVTNWCTLGSNYQTPDRREGRVNKKTKKSLSLRVLLLKRLCCATGSACTHVLNKAPILHMRLPACCLTASLSPPRNNSFPLSFASWYIYLYLLMLFSLQPTFTLSILFYFIFLICLSWDSVHSSYNSLKGLKNNVLQPIIFASVNQII